MDNTKYSHTADNKIQEYKVQSGSVIDELFISGCADFYKSKGFGSLLICSTEMCVSTMPRRKDISNALREANSKKTQGWPSQKRQTALHFLLFLRLRTCNHKGVIWVHRVCSLMQNYAKQGRRNQSNIIYKFQFLVSVLKFAAGHHDNFHRSLLTVIVNGSKLYDDLK